MLISAIIAVVVVCLIAVIGVGWYLSEQFRKLALLPVVYDPPFNLQVTDIQEDRCTLGLAPLASPSDRPYISDGVWGLEWRAGYAQIGPVLEHSDSHATCHFIPAFDRPQLGSLARYDTFAYPENPRQALGLPFEEVAVSSPLGEFPAWYVDGDKDTWAVVVHGRGAPLRECLRLIPYLTELGLPVLAISYRNDPGVPASPDGFYHFGTTEWQDLEWAVEYALGRGAKSVALIGYSMGGSIAASFMYRSVLRGLVRCIVMDSPMLDMDPVVRNGARQFGLLRLFTPIGMLMVSLRFGIEWDELDYVRRAHTLDAPVLLIHSRNDNVTPFETSERFASARQDIVTFVQFEEALHACAWNSAPQRYGAALREFLRPVVGP